MIKILNRKSYLHGKIERHNKYLLLNILCKARKNHFIRSGNLNIGCQVWSLLIIWSYDRLEPNDLDLLYKSIHSELGCDIISFGLQLPWFWLLYDVKTSQWTRNKGHYKYLCISDPSFLAIFELSYCMVAIIWNNLLDMKGSPIQGARTTEDSSKMKF